MRKCLPIVLVLSTTPALAQAGVPAGWRFTAVPGGAYVAGTQTLPGHQKAVFVRATVLGDPQRSNGRLSRVVSAAAHAGKRLRVWTRVKTDGTGPVHCYAAILKTDVILQGADAVIAAGTHDWTRCSVVLDIPRQASELRAGFDLSGSGTVWSDGFRFETVSRRVPLTPDRSPLEYPANLDFAQ